MGYFVLFSQSKERTYVKETGQRNKRGLWGKHSTRAHTRGWPALYEALLSHLNGN